MSIPIYRAMDIDNDEFEEGQFCMYKGHPTIFNEYGMNGVTVDINTLAIHFPSMTDKNGKKIFASLSEDGVGGDRLKISNGYPSCESERIAKFPQVEYKSFSQNDATTYSYEIIGIHKG